MLEETIGSSCVIVLVASLRQWVVREKLGGAPRDLVELS